MSSWHSYPKIYNVGHGAVQHIFDEPVLIEEKVDGSQFSFGVFNGELMIRSRGAVMHPSAPEKMFNKAVETVKQILPLLQDGWTYRAEYLSKPKHNTLAYDRTPNNHLIIFDINTSEEVYLNYNDKAMEAKRLGLEVVPAIHNGMIANSDELKALLDRTSVLGGQKIEGMVIKAYGKYGPDKKTLMAKHVSEHFKEVHQGDWKERNPGQNDILTQLVMDLRTPARWDKGIQHLREKGQLTNSPKDIGLLIKEIQSDTSEECADLMKEKLYQWAKSHVLRGVTNGFPEYYKNKLLESNFEK